MRRSTLFRGRLNIGHIEIGEKILSRTVGYKVVLKIQVSSCGVLVVLVCIVFTKVPRLCF